MNLSVFFLEFSFFAHLIKIQLGHYSTPFHCILIIYNSPLGVLNLLHYFSFYIEEKKKSVFLP